SPDIVLKKAITSAELYTDNTNGAASNVNDQLVSVNNGVTELLASKLSAYQKLYEANNLELEQITADLKNNQPAIDKTPALKTDFIAAGNKVTSAQNLKQSSESETNNNKKITVLIEATKKQTEALNQLNGLNKKIASQQSIANQKNNEANNTNVNKDNLANNKTNAAVKTNTVSNPKDNKNTVITPSVNIANTKVNKPDSTKDLTSNKGNTNGAGTKTLNTTAVTPKNNTNVVETKTTNANNNNNSGNTNEGNIAVNSAASGNPVDVKSFSLKDTSASEIVSLFENKVTLKNQKANTLFSNSIAELKYLESESKALENEIENAAGSTGGENAAQLKTKSDNLLSEAEEISVKAFDLRTLANTKSGTERDSIMLMAKKLDDESLNKKLDAVKLTEQSNQLVYTTNNLATNELLEKLKKEDPELASQLLEKTTEISGLKTKAQQLREEASSQPNANARIGATMNAEEKEAEMIQKQYEVLAEFKKRYPDYTVKETSLAGGSIPDNLKQKQTQLTEKKYELLTNLINGFSLEYETSKKNIPANLTADQKTAKQNAEDLNAESKRLLIKASTEKNTNEKIKLLAIASKTGDKAVTILNTLPKTNTNVAGTNPKNNNAATALNPKNGNTTLPANGNNNATTNPTANVTNKTNNNAGNTTIKVDGLEVIAGNAYTVEKPIPVDAKVPDGLIFRVQIGAFKTKLPDNAFRGLNPLNAETASNGYIRYTAGNFNKPENAMAVKNDLKNLGYTDAFVVVFYNGKRITMNEALELMAKEGKAIDINATQTAGITANTNIPKATVNVQNQNLNTQDVVAVTKELEQINGLLYTVQIGVFNRQVNKGKLYNLTPIYTEKLPNGLYRYTAGIYNNAEKLITDKRKVVTLGINDAFVSAYLNGKRITFAEGKSKQQDSSIKLEPENPIIFPELNSNFNPNPAVTNTTAPVNTNKAVQPFTNGVASYPAATSDNGVKPTEEGISFKVQIGAYSKQVPIDVAAKFSAIKNWPVENKQINTLFIYNIGNFTEAKFAKTLKEEAVKTGITDAFITVYKDGRKIYGAEASQYLNK
ncbi:MAG: hypothetical protein JWO32_2939, partial [Bacteroidetes bacterium]|nr:hypothetical protein [Bacteroidota bacterium]